MNKIVTNPKDDVTNTMFCRQCQETFGNSGCTKVGVCGKQPRTAELMDELVSRLEDLAAERPPTMELGRFAALSLFLTLTNANFDNKRLMSAVAEAEKRLGRVATRRKPSAFTDPNADARSPKELVLFGLKGIAAYCHHAAMFGREDEAIYAFIFKALKAMGEKRTIAEFADLVLECGRTAASAMALLDAANVAAYGNPKITRVNFGVGERPGILVSGHDALLSLGFRNIRLGPTLPAFLSPSVARTLVEKFGLRGIGNVEDDVKAILS